MTETEVLKLRVNLLENFLLESLQVMYNQSPPDHQERLQYLREMWADKRQELAAALEACAGEVEKE